MKGRGKNFDVSEYQRNGLSKEEILEIKETFDLFDIDRGGSIDPKELKEAMNSLGMEARN